MMGQRWMRMAGVVMAAMLAGFGLGGCDSGDDPDTGDLDGYFASHPFVVDPRTAANRVVSVSPSAAQVNQVGGKAVFTASGGTGSYHWDVANGSIGSVSGSGAQGVYTAILIGNNDVIVYDSDGNAAIAKIGGTTPDAMSVSAEPTSLASESSLSVVSVSGGQPPYHWHVSDPGRGKINGSTTGTSVVYMRGAEAGDNAVIVTDALGDSASIVIEQP